MVGVGYRSRPSYVPPEYTGRRNDPGKYTWDLLHDLSAPSIDRAVNKSRVQRLLEKLRSIEHQLAAFA